MIIIRLQDNSNTKVKKSQELFSINEDIMNKFIALTVSDFNQKTTVLVNLDTVKTIRPDFKTNGSILT